MVTDGFINLLETAYAGQLHSRAAWVVSHFGTLDETSLRSALSSIAKHWSEEFTAVTIQDEL
jgi:hypothetical protein